VTDVFGAQTQFAFTADGWRWHELKVADHLRDFLPVLQASDIAKLVDLLCTSIISGQNNPSQAIQEFYHLMQARQAIEIE